MALLFIDGFDHYATADIGKKWTAIVNTPTISSSGGRRSGGALSGQIGYSTSVGKTIAATTSFVMGAAFNYSAIPTAADVFKLIDVATLQCGVRVNADGTLYVHRNGTTLTSGTSTNALTTNAWNYIEWKVTIADSIAASSCVVKVNGAVWITVATGQDTKNSANASANQMVLGGTNGTVGITTLIDDFYLCDQSGSTNNDFLGDSRIDILYPTSDGNYSAFTPSTGVSHYALVDETTPNTTDYNDGAAVNDRDSYGMSNLAALASQTVYGVQVNAAILKDDAGARSAGTFVRSSSTNGDGASVALGTSQTYVSQIYETNPNGSVSWTETTINAMEAGVKVTA